MEPILNELNQTPNWQVILVIAYLLGSIPFGYVIARVFLGFDVRTKGSGNIGMTNVMRTGGKLPGIATFLLDFFKGSFAVVLALYTFKAGVLVVLLAGFFAVFGHTRSIFLKFTGGKGVATNLGIWLVIDWRVFLMMALIWVIVFLSTKISSLSALISLLVSPVVAITLHQGGPYAILATTLSLYIIVLHSTNIRRLLSGQEKRLSNKR